MTIISEDEHYFYDEIWFNDDWTIIIKKIEKKENYWFSKRLKYECKMTNEVYEILIHSKNKFEDWIDYVKIIWPEPYENWIYDCERKRFDDLFYKTLKEFDPEWKITELLIDFMTNLVQRAKERRDPLERIMKFKWAIDERRKLLSITSKYWCDMSEVEEDIKKAEAYIEDLTKYL